MIGSGALPCNPIQKESTLSDGLRKTRQAALSAFDSVVSSATKFPCEYAAHKPAHPRSISCCSSLRKVYKLFCWSTGKIDPFVRVGTNAVPKCTKLQLWSHPVWVAGLNFRQTGFAWAVMGCSIECWSDCCGTAVECETLWWSGGNSNGGNAWVLVLQLLLLTCWRSADVGYGSSGLRWSWDGNWICGGVTSDDAWFLLTLSIGLMVLACSGLERFWRGRDDTLPLPTWVSTCYQPQTYLRSWAGFWRRANSTRSGRLCSVCNERESKQHKNKHILVLLTKKTPDLHLTRIWSRQTQSPLTGQSAHKWMCTTLVLWSNIPTGLQSA